MRDLVRGRSRAPIPYHRRARPIVAQRRRRSAKVMSLDVLGEEQERLCVRAARPALQQLLQLRGALNKTLGARDDILGRRLAELRAQRLSDGDGSGLSGGRVVRVG